MFRAKKYNFNEQSDGDVNLSDKSRQRQTAQYVADMLLELRHLSKFNGFSTLQGLLEISYYEAFNEANKIDVPVGEEAFLHGLGTDARKAFVA